MNPFSQIIAPVMKIRTANLMKDVADIVVSTVEKCLITSYPRITREKKINPNETTIDIHQDASNSSHFIIILVKLIKHYTKAFKKNIFINSAINHK